MDEFRQRTVRSLGALAALQHRIDQLVYLIQMNRRPAIVCHERTDPHFYFGKIRANDDVTFSVEEGSIHGVVGENGAGKSTIMKILYGIYPPDGGYIELNGEKVTLRDPQHAIRKGIGMVHQHFMLVPTLTVWENIVLGSEPASC